MDCCCTYAGYFILGIFALKFLFWLINLITCYVLPKFSGHSTDFRKFGDYAVITGATDGIGKAYAFELARIGLKIVLIGRSAEKLQVTADEIAEKYKVEIVQVVHDFTNLDYGKVKSELHKLNIAVLVNNVGMGFEYPEVFLDVPNGDQVMDNMINVNATSVIKMCRIVLPGMRDKGKGVVINISSGSALTPTPLLQTYGATKAFVTSFTSALSAEMKDSKNIIIQCVMPFFVATKMSKIRNPSFFAPSPQFYSRSALLTVGRQSITHGCLSHEIQAGVVGVLNFLIPESLYQALMFKILDGARQKALKKLKSN